MKTRAWGFGFGLVVVAATALSGLGETFPLSFRTINKQDLRRFPGGYGNYGALRVQKPEGLLREPKPVSKVPLYAQCSGLIVRLDEAKDGKGYDRLIIDMNRNGDLTDDPVSSSDSPGTGANELVEFEAIKVPASLAVCGGMPQVIAEARVSNAEYLRSGTDRANVYAGQVILKAAWHLNTTAKLNGRSYRLGVYDANGNFKLGDGPRFSTNKREGQPENWYIGGGDTLLVDADGSGDFEGDRLGSESLALAPLVYLDQVPYKVALSADRTSLDLERWNAPLAEVALEPRPAQVRGVTLAWKQGEDQWEILKPALVGGKFKVPPGEYRLFTCTLVDRKSGAEPVFASAYDRLVRDLLHFEADRANTVRCGAPLDVRVSAEKRVPRPYESMGLQGSGTAGSEFVLAINANVVGAGGEGYSSYAIGPQFAKSPAKPTFTIADATGTKIASGNLEFG